MPRLPLLAGFKDPVTRPRYVIWSGVAVLVLAVVMVLALGITSSRWFCANGCHKVQDDTIIAYSHSSHDKVSCIACHEPLNADPVTFMMAKAKALGELYLTVTNQYELPLNAGDKLALDKNEMPSAQCLQCHDMNNRKITPSPGIIINHDIHAKNGITCTYCHNRVAHKEDFTLTLPGNEKHGDFMQMEACFRCHTLTPDKKTQLGYTATGKCSACHTPGFELKPASHLEAGFFPKGHGQLALKDKNYCLMCHNEQQFCYGCHALPMPHPADFKKTHGDLGKKDPQVCAKCHGSAGSSVNGNLVFCDNCHHKGSVPNIPWVSLTPGVPNQHPNVVKQQGATGCFTGTGGCHNPVFCAQCHVEGIKR